MLGKLPPINNFDCSYKPPNDGKVHTYYQTVYGNVDSGKKEVINDTDTTQQNNKCFMFQKYPDLEKIQKEMLDDPNCTGQYREQVLLKFDMINLKMMNPEHFDLPSNMEFNTLDDLKALINSEIDMDKRNISVFPNDSKYLDALNIGRLLFEKIEENEKVKESENDKFNGILITRF